MHGIGNDFIVVDNTQSSYPDLSNYAKELCDRRFGIGCDQLLIIQPSNMADFKMEIFNADGSQVEMCGNGIRCIAKYISDHGLSQKNSLNIETLAGIIKPKLLADLVEVDMGEPILSAKEIPTTLEGKIISYPLKIDDQEYAITCVSMGNPHCVIFVEDVDNFPVTSLGPKLEHHKLFPQRCNIEFIEVINDRHLKMRVWERGSGETLACGTGACASLVAAVLNQKSQREAKLELRGGNLNILWQEANNHVYMTGPAVEVYSGEIKLTRP